MLTDKLCPICASPDLKIFFELPDVPVNGNLLWINENDAINCPKGDIRLAFCPRCSYIFNLAFEPERQTYENYNNSLYYSPHFQSFTKSLAKRLIDRNNLHDKDIAEIGLGGKSNFLFLLCELGNNRGISFDPYNLINNENNLLIDRIKYINDFYSEKYSNYKFDLFFSWHVLEHLTDPKGLLNTLRRAIGNRQDTVVFFGVPNALNDFSRLFFWDVIYEHLSYFTPASLSFIFKTCGFMVCELIEEYEGQSLYISVTPDNNDNLDNIYPSQTEVKKIEDNITTFSANYYNKLKTYRNKLKHILDRGKRVVIWGAGSRGVTLLNTFKDLNISYAVDINPKKQGMYIPGVGQKIIPPEFLQKYRPDVIIVINPIYMNEIQNMVKNIGIEPNFLMV